ncbi:sigma-70 family RNA polymerase sigma factor, partial [Vibrio cholerae O1]
STVPAEENLPDMQVETLEMQEMIQREILKLPEKYRIMIVLKYIEELSLNEISEMLDIPLGTVKTRIHRGREALR